MAATEYAAFLERKTQLGGDFGFNPTFIPSKLFDFQSHLVDWSVRRGRGAVLADCGLGKSAVQLTWAQNIVEHTNKSVLLLTPLAVGAQMIGEAEKFGVAAVRARHGIAHGRPTIHIANYEQLHHFEPSDFAGVVCDESSILKHFSGATQKQVTRFMSHLPYRLLCTATAAPNDYTELGTSSEALGELGYSDMLSRFFSQSQRTPHRLNEIKADEKNKHRLAGLSRADQMARAEPWHLKPHASTAFWRWVCSWARACRYPSDLGFSDDGFVLPPLEERAHTVKARTLPSGWLFDRVAQGLQEEREERRRTLQERCEYVAELVAHDQPAVVWCHLNDEADLLTKLIPGSRQIKGGDSDDDKEETFTAFGSGRLRVLVTKPKIGAWGLNWQHCAHVVTFASHSYEQYYQSVRRCWRFGQQRPVVVDVVSTEGEAGVRENMVRKAEAAKAMFAALVEHMHSAERIARRRAGTCAMEAPAWLS
jgi:hypothetical protein